MDTERAQRNRAMAGLLAAGGALGWAALLVPGWPGRNVAALFVLSSLCALTGAVVLVAANRLSLWVTHLILFGGAVIIATSVAVGGGSAASATHGVYYLWIVVPAFMFLSPGGAAVHVGLAAASYGVVLVWLGEADAAPAQVLVTIGTAAGAGVVVGNLVGRIRRLATCDELTGLLNRRGFESAAGALLLAAGRHEAPVWVALLDLDGFKALNDRDGHAAGDDVLRRAGVGWRAQMRRDDLLARLGGDEFAVVMTGLGADEASGIVGRLLAATPTGVGCSAGMARWDGHEGLGDVLVRADVHLYAEKERRRTDRIGERVDQPAGL